MISLNNYLSNFWNAQTAIFLVIFLIAVFLSVRKKAEDGPMPKETSNELRGLAILGVLFAHLTYGKFYGTEFLFPFGIWGGVAVNLFLFLSGFGLAASAIYHPKPIGEFYRKRISKIYFPLWIFLAIFLLADALILNRFYPLSEILSAFVGFFPTANLATSINSPLWFITPLVLYYFLFPIVFRPKHPFWSIVGLIAISSLFYLPGWPVSNQIAYFYESHWLAFPLGALYAVLLVSPQAVCAKCRKFSVCWLYNGFLRRLIGKKIVPDAAKPVSKILLSIRNAPWRFMAVTVLAFLAGYTAYYSGVGKGLFLEQLYALFTMLCVVVLFVIKKFKFALLEIIGIYSFEIYLLHWPLIGRYDLIYKFLPPWLGTVIYIPLLILLAWLFSRLCQFVEEIFLHFKKIPN